MMKTLKKLFVCIFTLTLILTSKGSLTLQAVAADVDDTANIPFPPNLLEAGEDYIILAGDETLEYAISTDGINWVWQESSEFTGLEAGTTYQFIARHKKGRIVGEGTPSAVSGFKTHLAFEGRIEGIEAGKTYETNTTLTAAAIGAGMDNDTPIHGDSRWVPRTWNWGNDDNLWQGPPYTTTFTLTQAGAYVLTVHFELEEYTSEGWMPTQKTDSMNITFQAAAPIYTIAASAGAHGKITPTGTLDVEKGKTVVYTITPDKDYRLIKVVVDGTAVAFTDNKYTFTNVTKNHTISVEFAKMAPKTNDAFDAFHPVAYGMLAIFAFLLSIVTALWTKKTSDQFFR